MHRVSLPVRNPTADLCLSRWTLENTPRTCSYRMRSLVVPSPLHRSTPIIMPLPFPLITGRLSRTTDMILPFPQPHRWGPHINFLCIHRECRNHTKAASPSLPIPRLQPPLRRHHLTYTRTLASGGLDVATDWLPEGTGIWANTSERSMVLPETRRTLSAATGEIATSNCNG